MKIETILARKGLEIFTLRAEDTIQTASALLTTNKIGALPVRNKDNELIGILSERDVVRGLYEKGVGVADLKVSDLMTENVTTCSRADDVKAVQETMSNRHFRHMPVVENNQLVGMVSQGDVVKVCLEQSQMEANVMRDIAMTR